MSLDNPIEKAFGAIAVLGPSAGLDMLISLFDGRCGPGGEYDPLTIKEKAQAACDLYRILSRRLFGMGLSSPAIALLTDGWNRFGRQQREAKKRIYRAGIAAYLVSTYSWLGDGGAALRWALNTQADDMLGEHPDGGGAGKQWLLGPLGVSKQVVTDLNAIAARNIETVRSKYGNDWSSVLGFAENVVMRFALEKPEFGALFARESSVQEFPLSEGYFSALLERVSVHQATTADKGRSLEDLASYLFLLVHGWVPRRNLLGEDQSFETDIVVRNLSRASNLTAELLGRHFLVECKNWRKPVGVKDVGYFLYRMHLTHAGFGVILTKAGITGRKANEEAARGLVRRAFHEDGSICVVLDEADLRSMLDTQSSFWSILLERIERVRFGVQR